MDCDEAKTMLAGYADGELSSLENDALAAHMEQCGRCRQIVHDQQRMQHVFDSYQVPMVEEKDWSAIGKVLKAELEGKGEPVELKTRPRIDGLDPTPEPVAPVASEEAPRPVPIVRQVPTPTARPPAAPAAGRPPAVVPIKVRPRTARQPLRWMAHVAGAAAACLVMTLGLATLWTQAAPPLAPNTLARQGDVAIMELETDADYSVLLYAGDADDVVGIWVEPDGSNG